MIVSNYYAYLWGKMLQQSATPAGPITVKTLLGNATNIVVNSVSMGMFNYSTGTKYLPLVGDSDTPATIYDYNMGNDRSSDFSNLSLLYNNTVSFYDNEPCAESTGIITGTNTSADTITIKEFGTYMYYNNVNGLVNQGILVCHEILDNPITVAPGDTFQIPFTIRLF